MRQFLVWVAIAWLWMLTGFSAQAKWLEATTSNFIIYSDGNEKQLREMSERLERYDQVLRIMTGTKAEASPLKMTIYLLSSQSALNSIYPGDQKNVAGFYTTNMFGPVAFVPRLRSESVFDLDGETVLYHEYAHHFMMQYYPAAYPSWYVEGFAEYFSATDFRKSEIKVGAPAMHRLPSLALETWLPIERLLTLTYHDNKTAKEKEISQLYAQGWLLTHYLFSNKERQGQIGQYAINLNNGMGHKEAFEKAFKTDFATLGKELRSYYRDGKVLVRQLKPDDLKPVSVAVRLLAPAEEALLLPVARLRLGIAKDKRADFVTKFTQALAPHAATDAGRLAQAEWENAYGQSAKVQPLLEPVLKAKPDHAQALALQAYAAYRLSLSADEKSSPAAIKAARSYAAKANRAAPDTPLPLMLFYLSYRLEEKGATANALMGLERAWQLMPQDSYLSFLTATGVAMAGRKEDAGYYLRAVMNNPHGGASAARAQALMKAIESDANLGTPIQAEDEEE
jgi:Protein of unknown function (DUF1570)